MEDRLCSWFREKMIPVAGKEPLSILKISPAIDMHVGNKTVAVTFLYE